MHIRTTKLFPATLGLRRRIAALMFFVAGIATVVGISATGSSPSHPAAVSNCVPPPGVFRAVQWRSEDGGNDHYYEAVYVSNGITWDEAKTSAELRGGHLVTIANSAENDFAFSLVSSDERFWYLNEESHGIGPWLGGFQPPKSGEPDGGWSWVTGEPFSYSNWASGEPNNAGGEENELHFYSNTSSLIDNHWNDVGPTVLTNGYIVEYDSGDPGEGGLIGWWPGDGNARDIWNANNGSLQNGATFAGGEVAKAFSLDGKDDFVLVPPTTTTDAGSANSAFSVDAWIYPTTDDTNPIIEWSNDGTYGVHFWEGYGCLDGCGARGPLPGALYANIVDTSGNFHIFSTKNGVVPLNAWSHVALTYQYETGEAIIYLNGESVASASLGSFAPRTDLQLNFGARPFSDSGCSGQGCVFGGEIDEVELFDRALARDEILSIYNAGSDGKCKPQCVAPPDGLIAWYPGDGNAKDFVGGHHGTIDGNASFAPALVDYGFDFSEGGDITVNDSPSFHLTTFTIDAWVKGDGKTNRFIAYRTVPDLVAGEGEVFAYGIFFDAKAGYSCRITAENDASEAVYAGVFPQPDTFQHLAATYDGATLKIYVDGQLSGSVATSIVPSQVAGNFVIGSYPGVTDEVEVFDRALSAEEIASIVAARSAGKCKPQQTDVDTAFVDKNEAFVQTGTADPMPRDPAPFRLMIGLHGTGFGNITSASFTPPGGSATPLASSDEIDFNFSSAGFVNLGGFNAAFPNGDYAFHIDTAHAPFQVMPIITIAGDSFPPVPKILNTNWSSAALSIDHPDETFMFQWSEFCTKCGGKSTHASGINGSLTDTAYITLRIADSLNNVVLEQSFADDVTSFVMPADTLQSGRTYRAQLQFANLQDRNENGVQLSGQYAAITLFDVVTAAAPSPTPTPTPSPTPTATPTPSPTPTPTATPTPTPTPTPSPTPTPTPTPTAFYFNGHTYMLTSLPGTWIQAEAEAVANGGHLVSINSVAEQNFLVTTFLTGTFLHQPLWIGLTDQRKEGKFAWSDGSKLTYTNWNHSSHEPNDCCNRKVKHEEDYVAMNWHYARNGNDPIGTWNDCPRGGTTLTGNAMGPYFGIIEIPSIPAQ